jgi:hypothetical protein
MVCWLHGSGINVRQVYVMFSDSSAILFEEVWFDNCMVSMGLMLQI